MDASKSKVTKRRYQIVYYHSGAVAAASLCDILFTALRTPYSGILKSVNNNIGEPPGNRTRDTLLKRKTKALRVDYHI